MTDAPQKASWLTCNTSSAQDKRNQLQVAAGTILWALVYSGSSLLIKKEILQPGPLAWAVATLPMIAGLLLLIAYARFLRQTDELQRMVQLQAMAIGFGGAFFGFAGYKIFELLGAPAADYDHFIVVTCVLYSLGTLIGWWRYR
jgi:drug/metabolite transporter (DMT)-like permease